MDWTWNVGVLVLIIVQLLTALGAWFTFRAYVQQTLKTHAEALHKHAERLDRHEDHIVKIIGDLRHVIGRLEGTLQIRVQSRES